MIYSKTISNTRYTWDVKIINLDSLKELINTICDAGYDKKGDILLNCRAEEYCVRKELERRLPNGQLAYTRDSGYKSDYCNPKYEYAGRAIIHGEERVVPQLANIVKALVDCFGEYEKIICSLNVAGLDNIDEMTEATRKAYTALSDSESEMKKELMNKLFSLRQIQEKKDALSKINERFTLSLNSLMRYQYSDEMLPIDERVAKAKADYDKATNEINTETADLRDVITQSNAHNHLRALQLARENGEVFDIESLKTSYIHVLNLFSISLLFVGNDRIKNPSQESLREFLINNDDTSQVIDLTTQDCK